MRNKRTKPPGCHLTAVWEFEVNSEKPHAFEKAYGPNGDWARFFRQGEGYIRTELIRDPKRPGRYVTLDFWTSRLAYLRFKRQHLAAYKALDKRCEKLTQNEGCIGEFEKSVAAKLIWSTESSTVNDTRVRLATPADVPSIIAIERSAHSAAHWSESAYSQIFQAGTPTRIAIVGEDARCLVLGFVIARLSSQECELENIVVAERVQCQGIATSLLQALKIEIRKRQVTQIILEVRESNNAARALYEKCGFELNRRRKAYYPDPVEDALVYGLNL